jgi:hypothetical protein
LGTTVGAKIMSQATSLIRQILPALAYDGLCVVNTLNQTPFNTRNGRSNSKFRYMSSVCGLSVHFEGQCRSVPNDLNIQKLNLTLWLHLHSEPGWRPESAEVAEGVVYSVRTMNCVIHRPEPQRCVALCRANSKFHKMLHVDVANDGRFA